ncbi:MAG: hypothetical protein EXS05_00335 [Planctomycetaceae bacterium]|nr:hypothetical protein [Planctomycetaceae bacterium]
MPDLPSTPRPDPPERRSGSIVGPRLAALLVVATAVALTMLFWPTLWQGGGLVGGDIYYYYLPQKAYYAECLRAGTLPLWNNLIGNGYPQLAESQTGVLYPFHLVLYRWLDLNTAFNANLLGHYVLAFVGCWLLARRLDCNRLAAVFAALVYTYSWFPPRISLEWSIIGGAWLPMAVWCVESFVQTRFWRFGLGLTIVLGLQLLAGHFLVAFLTQLLVVGYVPLRLWFAGRDLPESTRASRGATCLWLFAAFAGSYLLAAAQLVPTWELKLQSQRSGVTAEHDPAYGYIPPQYLWQMIAPWDNYFDPEKFESLKDPHRPATNRVEAHLYFGLMPLILAVVGLYGALRDGNRRLLVWFAIGTLAIVYTPGWLLPLTNRLPGFSFFEGPGRYGILATLAAAVLAATGFEIVLRRLKAAAQPVFAVVVFAATTADLLWVSGLIHNAEQVPDPAIKSLSQSTLQARFAGLPEPARVFNEANNIPSLAGVATLPVYLGLSPAAYYDPQLMFPPPNVYPFAEATPTPEQIDWLRRMGVTHILSLNQINPIRWSARALWMLPDDCLNPPLARRPTDAFWVYELEGSRGRAAWRDPESGPKPRIDDYTPHRVQIVAESERGGTLVLTDLAYPGWQVEVDGRPAKGLVIDGMLRGVALSAGQHTISWSYRPASVDWGAAISAVTLISLLVLGHLRYWHPGLLSRSGNDPLQPAPHSSGLQSVP